MTFEELTAITVPMGHTEIMRMTVIRLYGQHSSFTFCLDRDAHGAVTFRWSVGLPLKMAWDIANHELEKLGIEHGITLDEAFGIDEVASRCLACCRKGSKQVPASAASLFLDGTAQRLLTQTERVWGLDGFSYRIDFPGREPIEQWCYWHPELAPVARQLNHLIALAGLDPREYGPGISG